jgi:hypothetical protein
MNLDNYRIDQVLNGTHQVINELKNQLAREEAKLSELESLMPSSINYVNDNDYSSPAWFGSAGTH